MEKCFFSFVCSFLRLTLDWRILMDRSTSVLFFFPRETKTNLNLNWILLAFLSELLCWEKQQRLGWIWNAIVSCVQFRILQRRNLWPSAKWLLILFVIGFSKTLLLRFLLIVNIKKVICFYSVWFLFLWQGFDFFNMHIVICYRPSKSLSSSSFSDMFLNCTCWRLFGRLVWLTYVTVQLWALSKLLHSVQFQKKHKLLWKKLHV